MAPMTIAAQLIARPHSASRPAQPSRAPPPARIGVSPDQNATTVSSPRIDSVKAVAPAASRCSPRGTTQPKTTAAATAMIAQTTRNSLAPWFSPPDQVPTAASVVAIAMAAMATGATTRSETDLLMLSLLGLGGLEQCPPATPDRHRRRARSTVTRGGDLQVAPESDAPSG